jgi:hypothetical protein
MPIDAHAAKTVNVTVYHRKHWSRAILWIAIGVVGAYGVRRFVQGGKDRLKVRRTLADVKPRLAVTRDEAREPAHVAAALVLSAEIDQRYRDARWKADGATLLKATTRLVARVYLLAAPSARSTGWWPSPWSRSTARTGAASIRSSSSGRPTCSG